MQWTDDAYTFQKISVYVVVCLDHGFFFFFFTLVSLVCYSYCSGLNRHFSEDATDMAASCIENPMLLACIRHYFADEHQITWSDYAWLLYFLFVCLMVYNATFIGEGNRSTREPTDKLYHITFYTSPWSRFELITSVVIGTDCIGSCKSNHHTITATTAPLDCCKANSLHPFSSRSNFPRCVQPIITWRFVFNKFLVINITYMLLIWR
jgi:hypothetical protein